MNSEKQKDHGLPKLGRRIRMWRRRLAGAAVKAETKMIGKV